MTLVKGLYKANKLKDHSIEKVVKAKNTKEENAETGNKVLVSLDSSSD